MNEKKCPNCEEIKSLSEFHLKKTFNRYSSWCKKCVYIAQKRRWKDKKRKAISLLGGCCCKCGYKKNMAALQFHHLNPEDKEFNWDKLRLHSWDTITKELKKCILVCANCHCETHAPDENLNLIGYGKDNVSLNLVLASTGKCPVCDNDVYGTIYCNQDCARLGSRRVRVRPSKEVLTKKIKTMSMVKIGKEYGVSDNAIRKWAIAYEII